MPEGIKLCQHEGCDQPGIECELPWVYGDPIDKPPEYEYYCAEHAFEHGYCYMCGHFWAGCEAFDFGRGHLCPNCHSGMRAEEEDEEEYDDCQYDEVGYPVQH